MNLNGFTLKFIRIYMAVRFDCYRFGVDMFCKHSVWISTNAFLGRTPDPPAQFLRDDSDADDACDANDAV